MRVRPWIVIRNNRIWGAGSFVWGPIFAFGTRDAVISDNQITGGCFCLR